jgi:Putative zinc-finger
MSGSRRTDMTPEHHEIAALIPWYVNATLDRAARQRVDSHLDACAICRDDLRTEQRIFEALDVETAIEYMPAASLKRLQAQLDAAQEPAASAVQAPAHAAVDGKKWRRPLLAASIAAVAVAVTVLMADRWMPLRAQLLAPNYHTVTSAEQRPKDEVIRAVFAPSITLVELQAILDESQLRIVSGPTEAGVYSLAGKPGQSVTASLALLRRHSTVRFAEGTRLEPEPGSAP